MLDEDNNTIHQVEIVVCAACLDGIGEECHVPACLFCFRDVPRLEEGTLRQLIEGRGLIDGKLPLDGQLIELEAGEGLTVDQAMEAIDAINDTELDNWTAAVRGVIERVQEHGRHLGPHPWEIEGRVGFFKRVEMAEPSDDSDLIDEDPPWECSSCGEVYSARMRPLASDITCPGCEGRNG